MILNCKVLTEKLLQVKQNIYLLKKKVNQLKKLSLNYLLGRIVFYGEDSIQNYLVFQSIPKHFKTIAGVGNGS